MKHHPLTNRTALCLVFCASVLMPSGVLFAHEYPAVLQVVAGTTNTFSVTDPGTCVAYVSAVVNSPPLVTVSPSDGSGVSVPFTVIASTNTGDTTITLQWIGSDVITGMGPCTEDTRPAGRTIVVHVIDPKPGSTANNPSSAPHRDPVNTFNGELYFHEKPDIDLGGPLPLIFQRYYASNLRKNFVVGNLGDNWRHNFDWRLHWVGNLIVLVTDTGKVLKYLKEGSDWKLKTPTDNLYQVVQMGQQIVVGDARNGRTYLFDAGGYLVQISDGKGNSLYLTYVDGLLSTVSDNLSSASARQLQLYYSGDKLTLIVVYYGFNYAYAVNYIYTGDNLTGYYDANSRTTHYVYDTVNPNFGLLKWIQRPVGNIPWKETWDDVGKVAAQTDAYGNVTSFNYGPPETPGTTIVTNPLNQTTTYIHDSSGSLLSMTDPDGKMTSLVTGTNLLRNQVTNPQGSLFNRSFLPATGSAITETDENGNPVTYVYSPRTLANGIVFQDLTEVVYSDGASESFGYDTMGNLINYTNQAGYIWTYTYDSYGQPLTIQNPLGGITTNAYDDFRDLAASRDPAGNVTTYVYDNFKRLSQVIWADGTYRSFQYDNLNHLLSRTDERGNNIAMLYDENGNMIRMTDRLQNLTLFSYDLMDRLSIITFLIGNPAYYSYDTLGRIATVTSPGTNVISFAYNARGQETAVWDLLGLVKSNAFDDAGWLVSSSDALGNLTAFDRDPAGRLTRLTSPAGHVLDVGYDAMDRARTAAVGGAVSQVTFDSRGLPTDIMLPGGETGAQYVFNGLGELTQMTDGNSNTWSRQYDLQGRMTSATDPSGNSLMFSCDNRNRISQTIFPGGLGYVTNTYDPVGNLTEALYSDGTELVYGYDAGNNLTNGNNISLGYDIRGRVINCNSLGLQYDFARRVSRLTYTNGVYVDYEYNCRDQLIRATDWLGGQTEFSYDAAGRLTNIMRPNLVQTIYHYDADNNVTEIETRKNPDEISDVILQWNESGQLVSENRSGPAILPALALSSADRQFDYTVSSQDAAQTFDALGRLTSDGVRTYTWDLASRLMSWTQGAETVNFAYNGLGDPVSRSDGASSVQYVWNYGFTRPCIAMIRNGSTSAVIQYNVCTPDGELLYAVLADNSRRFYHFDQAGNTSFISDDSGTPIAAYRYTTFGEILTDSSNGAVDNPFAFQGRYSVIREGNNGLYSMRARYYDSATGRFISRDPTPTPYAPFLNPYQYVGGNPLLFRDPSGKEITKTDVAQGTANTFGTALGTSVNSSSQSVVDAAASKLGRIAQAAGDGPAAKALAQNAKNIAKAGKVLNGVGYGAAVAGAAFEANDLNNRLDDIKRRRNAEENRLVNNAANFTKEARELFKQGKITYEEYEKMLHDYDAGFMERLTANSDIGFVDTALESTKSLLKSVAGLAPIPGGVWDSYFNWLSK